MLRNAFICVGICVGLLFTGMLAAFAAETAQTTAEDHALAARVKSLLQQVVDSPGRERGHWLTHGGMTEPLGRLLGDVPSTAEQLTAVRTSMLKLANDLQEAVSWPHPPTNVTVPYTATPPVIDGVPNESCWRKAAVFTRVYPFNQRKATKTPATTWRLLWDERYLYVAMTATDPDIVAPTLARDDEVYNADCLEVFLLPDMATRKYWEIEVGATNSLFDAINIKNPDAWGCDYHKEANMQGLLTATRVDGTPNLSADKDRGYTVEIAIPFAELPDAKPGSLATPGMQLHFLLTRLDRNGATLIPYGCCPVITWVHNIWNYGTMRLVK